MNRLRPDRLRPSRLRPSRLSLRVRLAALIGLTLVVCGVVLLSISYGLVSSNLNAPLAHGRRGAIRASAAGVTGRRRAGAVPRHFPSNVNVAHPNSPATGPKAAAQRALRKRTLDQLVTQYLAVLAGVVIVAVALGWLLAGQLLRAIRRITRVAERVSDRNLAERVGLEGPRDELRELADAFDGMLARLDGVFKAQRRFVADASHELRTPLAAMRAEIEVLAADPDAAAADVDAATRVLRRQLRRSEELIEALLALARSQPELLVRERVDIARLVGEALEDAGARVSARRLQVEQALAPAVVHGDRRLLTLLVGNLLDNAIKHNHDRGWIRIHTGADADTAVLTIANSGQAVAADELQELAQAFRRGGRARVGDGHGLGLAIAQAVTRAHLGTMTLEREPGGGLSVELRLPPALDQSQDAARGAQPPAGAVTPSP